MRHPRSREVLLQKFYYLEFMDAIDVGIEETHRNGFDRLGFQRLNNGQEIFGGMQGFNDFAGMRDALVHFKA